MGTLYLVYRNILMWQRSCDGAERFCQRRGDARFMWAPFPDTWNLSAGHAEPSCTPLPRVYWGICFQAGSLEIHAPERERAGCPALSIVLH